MSHKQDTGKLKTECPDSMNGRKDATADRLAMLLEASETPSLIVMLISTFVLETLWYQYVDDLKPEIKIRRPPGRNRKAAAAWTRENIPLLLKLALRDDTRLKPCQTFVDISTRKQRERAAVKL